VTNLLQKSRNSLSSDVMCPSSFWQRAARPRECY
jgi:hypothetical protein